MAAGIYDIVIEKGATYSLGVAVKYSTGLPKDLTGYAMRMQIRKTEDGPAILSMAAGAPHFINIVPLSGSFTVYIGATFTKYLPAGRFIYDLEVYHTTDLNDVMRLLKGRVDIQEEITTI